MNRLFTTIWTGSKKETAPSDDCSEGDSNKNPNGAATAAAASDDDTPVSVESLDSDQSVTDNDLNIMEERRHHSLDKEIQDTKRQLVELRLRGMESQKQQIQALQELQSTLQTRRNELPMKLNMAKQAVGFWEYARILRDEFDKESLKYSWHAWCEAWLLRAIHHAMIVKDQHDTVQRNCNSLLMELYAETMPKLKEDKLSITATLTAEIIVLEQSKARLQQEYHKCLSLQEEIKEILESNDEEGMIQRESFEEDGKKSSSLHRDKVDRPILPISHAKGELVLRMEHSHEDNEKLESSHGSLQRVSGGKGILKNKPDRWKEGKHSTGPLPPRRRPEIDTRDVEDTDVMVNNAETVLIHHSLDYMPPFVEPGLVDD